MVERNKVNVASMVGSGTIIDVAENAISAIEEIEKRRGGTISYVDLDLAGVAQKNKEGKIDLKVFIGGQEIRDSLIQRVKFRWVAPEYIGGNISNEK